MSEPIPCPIDRTVKGKKEIILMQYTEPDEMKLVGFSVIIREDTKETLVFSDTNVRKAKAKFDELCA